MITGCYNLDRKQITSVESSFTKLTKSLIFPLSRFRRCGTVAKGLRSSIL